MITQILTQSLKAARHILHNLTPMSHKHIISQLVGIALKVRPNGLVCAIGKIDTTQIEIRRKMPIVGTI